MVSCFHTSTKFSSSHGTFLDYILLVNGSFFNVITLLLCPTTLPSLNTTSLSLNLGKPLSHTKFRPALHYIIAPYFLFYYSVTYNWLIASQVPILSILQSRWFFWPLSPFLLTPIRENLLQPTYKNCSYAKILAFFFLFFHFH